MSTPSMPPIPPRPGRKASPQLPTTNPGNTLGSNIPVIPSRPQRRIDRSASPSRFASSPLNEPVFAPNKPATLQVDESSTLDKPRRPQSVSAMPSLGQEGIEYDSIAPEEEKQESPETINIAEDLKLHAPKASLPKESATERIETVTRTDSSQAASFGIGKPKHERDGSEDSNPQSLRATPSFTGSTHGVECPGTAHGEEDQPYGAEVGQRVPMYPNAGLVQAPSPAPHASPYGKGIGFHNDGSKPRHHSRRTSGHGPPGSYGMHGHGIIPKDKMEQTYYEKHPELWRKELYAHGDEKKEWAMSSDDLNKIVRDTASRGAGLGTYRDAVSTPTEQIGYAATEEFVQRMSSSKPSSTVQHSKAPSNTSDAPLKSPLRHENDGGDLIRTITGASEAAAESEVDDEHTVHVDAPSRRVSKIYGGPKTADSTENLGPDGGNTEDAGGLITETGYGVPILASDEVAKEPANYEKQPAVSPQNDNEYLAFNRASEHGSKPSSRPGSIHGIPNISFQAGFDKEAHSTPLADVEEYEPLFDEDEKDEKKEEETEASPTIEGKDHPSALKSKKFPSRDVWEDAPDSHMHTASVSTPQLGEEDGSQTMDVPKVEEGQNKGQNKSQAFAQHQDNLAETGSRDENLKVTAAEPKQPWDALIEARKTTPGINRYAEKQRFPSKDIWEDAPESQQHQTVVSGPQGEHLEAHLPEDERPTTGAVAFHQEKQAEGIPLNKEEGRATTGVAAVIRPSIPPRPAKKLTDPKPELNPAIPQRDGSAAPANRSPTSGKPPAPLALKPLIPPRPARKPSRDSSDTGEPLTTVSSAGSAKEAAAALEAAAKLRPKPKPPVPARPIGSKIAALQGGFMSELNKRLGHGPVAPKPKDEPKPEEVAEVKEQKPLADARKGRARGPARRAPVKVEKTKSGDVPPAPKKVAEQKLGMCVATTMWEISPEDGDVTVSGTATPKIEEIEQKDDGSAYHDAAERKPVGSAQNPPDDAEPIIKEVQAKIEDEESLFRNETEKPHREAQIPVGSVPKPADDPEPLIKKVQSEVEAEESPFGAQSLEKERDEEKLPIGTAPKANDDPQPMIKDVQADVESKTEQEEKDERPAYHGDEKKPVGFVQNPPDDPETMIKDVQASAEAVAEPYTGATALGHVLMTTMEVVADTAASASTTVEKLTGTDTPGATSPARSGAATPTSLAMEEPERKLSTVEATAALAEIEAKARDLARPENAAEAEAPQDGAVSERLEGAHPAMAPIPPIAVKEQATGAEMQNVAGEEMQKCVGVEKQEKEENDETIKLE